MEPFSILSTSDQLAKHLKNQILKGTIKGTMPGVAQIVKTLGVNKAAVTKALIQLENEGLVISQGDRRRRLISSTQSAKKNKLQVGMLCYDSDDMSSQDALLIKQELLNSGHDVLVAPQHMQDLRMDVKRVAPYINSLDIDAWIIRSGSRPVLEWFGQQNKPAFALHGRVNNITLASMTILRAPVIVNMISKLVALGHRRIVMFTREDRRKPSLGTPELFFLEQLEANGIQTSNYNIPDWDDTPAGLQNVIDAIFKHTPPSAIIVSDSTLLHAIQVHLAQKGIWAPKHISLFCSDSQPSFDWVRPQIAHIRWDYRPAIRRIKQWANNVAQGKVDNKKSHIKASLSEGETMGPAPILP